MKTRLFLTGLAIMAVTTWAAAQNSNTGNRPQNGTGKGSAFVDNNKNGTCDNYENRTPSGTGSQGSAYGRGNGTGKAQGNRRGNGKRQGEGRNFTDVNKNGVCDRLESTSTNKPK